MLLQLPLESPFILILQKEAPSLRSLLSEPVHLPSSGVVRNKTCWFQWLEVHPKAPCTQKQPHSWQEREATTKTVYYTIPYATQDKPAVSMATTAFLSNTCTFGSDKIMLYYRKELRAALHCSICRASKYLASYNKDIFHFMYCYKWVGFSSSLIYKCIQFGLENPCSGFHDNRSDFLRLFLPFTSSWVGKTFCPFPVTVQWASKMIA